MHDLFISYSSKDKLIADAICARLESDGIRCWIAPRDILPGQNYAGQLAGAIRKTRLMILVLSGHANLSVHVLKEVELAVRVGLTILPFRIEEITLSDDLDYYLSNVHWLDALTPPMETHLKTLSNSVQALLQTAIPAREETEEIPGIPEYPPFIPQAASPVTPSAGLVPALQDVEAITTIQTTPEISAHKEQPAPPPQLPKAEKKVPHKEKRSKSLSTQSRSAHVRSWVWITLAGVLAAAVILVVLLNLNLTGKPSTGIPSYTPNHTATVRPINTATQESTPIPTPLVFNMGYQNVIHEDMVFIPAGEFLMGTNNPESYFSNAQPEHTVYLDAFQIDRTEVTNSQYEQCVTAGKCTPPHSFSSDTRFSYYGNPEYANFPVMHVTWSQADSYCTWLGKSLPSEAQWEKAARGTDGRKFPWGDQDPTNLLANVQTGDTVAVGSYPDGASPYGVLDMAGNLHEWTADWYGDNYYQVGPTVNPAGPATGDRRCLRGGSYAASGDYFDVISYFRNTDPPDYFVNRNGFRCASAVASSSSRSILASGSNHTCLVTSEGGVLCWGLNEYGQLGDDTTQDRLEPVQVLGLEHGVREVDAGDRHTCALMDTGEVKCWGWRLLDEDTLDYITKPETVEGLPEGIVAFAAGSTHNCALSSAGAVYCWGINNLGQLGNDSLEDSNLPVTVSGLESGVVKITAGLNFSCALISTGEVRCWGANDAGTLGDGSNTAQYPYRSTPVAVVGLEDEIVDISSGSMYSCALTLGGAGYCWGRDVYGELGNDLEPSDSGVPVRVDLDKPILLITAGFENAYALSVNGNWFAWGRNLSGTLGNGTEFAQFTPVLVTVLEDNAVRVTNGEQHTCILTDAGLVLCWGGNDRGQLGNGTTENSDRPQLVTGSQ